MKLAGRTPLHFAVGQTVWVRETNQRGAHPCTVVKVGRELVHIESSIRPHPVPFKLDPATGVVRDFGQAYVSEDGPEIERLSTKLRLLLADKLRTTELSYGQIVDAARLLDVPLPDRLKQLLGVRP